MRRTPGNNLGARAAPPPTVKPAIQRFAIFNLGLSLMRVVYLNPSGKIGGAESSLLDVLASLSSTKPDWSLRLVMASDGPLGERAESLGVPATVVPFPPALARLGDAGAGGPAGRRVGQLSLLLRLLYASPAVNSYRRQLQRELRRLNPDVIHTNGFKMHVLGIWSRPTGVPVVWHIHDYVSTRPIMARLLRRYSNRCAAVVTNSKSVSRDVRRVCDNGLKVYSVYNAVDLTRFSPDGTSLDLDSIAGLDPAEPGTLKVGLMATLGRWKGHEVFLKALSLLPSGAKVRGYVIGGALYQTDGSQHALEDLREYAVRLGIEERVGFTGFVNEPAAAIRALDIVVHASTQPEPFGLVIVEAMACGRPVIASLAGGVGEIVEAGENALVHEPGDAAGLAKSIERLATDVVLRGRLAGAGRATAELRFDRDRLAAELIPIYESLGTPDFQTHEQVSR
ncbi:MAG: glycosyltransferase [Blastocatellia bacterium]